LVDFYEYSSEKKRFHRTDEFPLLTEDILVSQEGLCSMSLEHLKWKLKVLQEKCGLLQFFSHVLCSVLSIYSSQLLLNSVGYMLYTGCFRRNGKYFRRW